MMIRTLLIISALALAALTIPAQNTPDRSTAFLKGPVKSVSSTFIEFFSDEPKKTPPVLKGDTVIYDLNGFEIEHFVANDAGEFADREVHRRDESGRFITTEHYNSAGKLWAKEIFKYVDGKLSEKLAYDGANVLNLRTSYRYDLEGRLLEETYRDPTEVRGRTHYTYSGSSPHPGEIKFVDQDGKKMTAPLGPCAGAHRITFSYDDEDRVSTKVLFDQRNKEQERFTHRYLPSGLYEQLIRKKTNERVVHSYEYRFDSHGNWIEETITRKWEGFTPSHPGNLSDPTERFGNPLGQLRLFERLRTVKTVTTRKIEYY